MQTNIPLALDGQSRYTRAAHESRKRLFPQPSMERCTLETMKRCGAFQGMMPCDNTCTYTYRQKSLRAYRQHLPTAVRARSMLL